MAEYWLTSKVALELGCSDATIRTLKSRHKALLLENRHWQKTEDNRTVWSDEGVEILRSLLSGNAPETIPQSPGPLDTRDLQDCSDWPETGSQSTDTVIDVSSHNADEHPAMKVAWMVAEEIALEEVKQFLPAALAAVYTRWLTQPTQDDRRRLFELGSVVNPPSLQSAIADNLPALQASYRLYGGEL